jgi:hypothetical protein
MIVMITANTPSENAANRSMVPFRLGIRPPLDTRFYNRHQRITSVMNSPDQMPLISPPSMRAEVPVIHFAAGDTM